MKRLIILVLLACICAAVYGDTDTGNYWVVGGSTDKAAAIREGERLSSATGVEVLLQPVGQNGDIRYRLLVRLFTDEYDQVRLKSQLRFAGAKEITLIGFTGNESELQSLFAVIDYRGEVIGSSDPTLPESVIEPEIQSIFVPDKIQKTSMTDDSDYLVLGSFRQSVQAEKYRITLQVFFGGVFLKEVMSGEHVLHRVVVGPVSSFEEEEYRRKATLAGIEGAWMLRGAAPVPVPDGATKPDVVAVASEILLATEPSTETEPLPEAELTPVSEVERKSSASPDDPYNLAELNKTTGGFFLNPKR